MSLDKARLQMFRNQLQLSSQIPDFVFHSPNELLAVTKSGLIKTYDFFSGDLEKVKQYKQANS